MEAKRELIKVIIQMRGPEDEIKKGKGPFGGLPRVWLAA
jgi:hypothetical protein